MSLVKKFIFSLLLLMSFVILPEFSVDAKDNIIKANSNNKGEIQVRYGINDNGKRYLKWSKVNKAYKYVIERTVTDSSLTKRIMTKKTKYSENLDSHAYCDFTITAYKKNGKEIASSDTVDIAYKYPTIDNVKYKQVNFNQLKLVWDSSDPNLKYEIYKKNKEGNFELLEDNIKGTSYIDKNTECNKSYSYKVVPYRKFSDRSSIVGVTYKTGKLKLNKNNPNIINLDRQDNNVTVEIDYIPDADVYKLFRKRNNSTWKQIKLLKRVIYTDRLTAIGKYTYKAIAGKKRGGSIYWCESGKTKTVNYDSISASTESNDGVVYSSKFVSESPNLTPIIGKNGATVNQLVKYYKKYQKSYPAIYASKGAPTIRDFCRIVYKTCKRYGIRDEIVFAQMMLETGYLSFTGDVSVEQCNFGGMGATGGVSGSSYLSVADGIKAQVQHLRMYADKNYKLSGDNKDDRFSQYLIGKIPYVEWLSKSENPYGVCWATSPTYKEHLMAKVNEIIIM